MWDGVGRMSVFSEFESFRQRRLIPVFWAIYGPPIDATMKGVVAFASYEQGSPSDTRDYVNEFIPTPEQVKNNFVFNQTMQEMAYRGMRVALPGGVPVKVALETYTLYDYFNS
ncbi:MAG: hypothetical protein [Circular genetic element sp.]|nr:MAG: hypothetical protein [Circular genetic element sp.]